MAKFMTYYWLNLFSIGKGIGVRKDHVYRVFGLGSEKSINMFFKNFKRWDFTKMFNKNIPGSNCIREKTIHVSV